MSQEHAWPLIEAGYNAAELSEALEVSGQTAREYIRQYRATQGQSHGKPQKVGSSWTERFSLTLLWSLGTGSH